MITLQKQVCIPLPLQARADAEEAERREQAKAANAAKIAAMAASGQLGGVPTGVAHACGLKCISLTCCLVCHHVMRHT